MPVTSAERKTKPWFSVLPIASVPLAASVYVITGLVLLPLPYFQWILVGFLGVFILWIVALERHDKRHTNVLYRYGETIDCDKVFIVEVSRKRMKRSLGTVKGLTWFKDGLLHFWAPDIEYHIAREWLIVQKARGLSDRTREAYCVAPDRSAFLYLSFTLKHTLRSIKGDDDHLLFGQEFDAWMASATPSTDGAKFPPITRQCSAMSPITLFLHLLLFSVFMTWGSFRVSQWSSQSSIGTHLWENSFFLFLVVSVMSLGALAASLVISIHKWKRNRNLTEAELIAELTKKNGY